ncbi:MAG: hypothetical protein WCA01_01105 [Burkholderiales bacterium]
MKAFRISSVASLVLIAGGCQSIIPNQTPDYSLRLAQIVEYATRNQILAEKPLHEAIKKAGGDLEKVGNSSFAAGRVQCCGGPNERETAIAFFIPEGITTQLDDVVEIRSGGSKESGVINVVTRVRDGSKCRWVPEDPRLWRRVLYCDGLKDEGWEQQTGLWNFWIKRATQ